MPAYSPQLDDLIRSYGNFFEAQLKDMTNPQSNTLATAIRIAFRTKTRGEPLRDKIWLHTGWDVAANPETHIPALIALAEQNGSSAAQKLKSGLPVYTKLMETLKTDLPDNTGLLKGVRHAKKMNLSY